MTNYAVSTPTQKEYDKLMELYEKVGWKRRTGVSPKALDKWEQYKNDTYIGFMNNFTCSPNGFYFSN